MFGLLQLNDKRPDQFTPDDIRFCEELCACVGTVLTKRRAEAELYQGEALYRSLFGSSPVPLWYEDASRLKAYVDRLKESGVTDFKAFVHSHPGRAARCLKLIKALHVNTATLKLFEASSRQELMGSLSEILRGEALDMLAAELGCIANGKQECGGETIVYTVSGERRQVIWRWTVLDRYERSMSRVLISLLDITDRKKAEQALQQGEELFRTIVSNTAGVLLIVDPNGVILYASPGGGFAGEKATIGTNAFEPLAPDFGHRCGRALHDAIEHNKIVTVEHPGVADTWWLSRFAHLAYYKGVPDLGLIVSTEITALKEAEQKLQTGQQIVRALLDASPDVVALIDTNGRLLDLNEAAARRFHRSRDALVGLPMWEVFPQELADQRMEQVREAARSLRPVVSEDTHLGAWFQSTFHPVLGGDGNGVAVAVHTRDVTAEKARADHDRQHSEALQNAVDQRTTRIGNLEREKAESDKLAVTGRMAARIAHEINNPLGGIRNCFELISRAVPQDHRHYRFVDMGAREIERISNIVRQMFALYRPEEKEVYKFMPGIAIEEVKALLARECQAQNVSLDVDSVDPSATVQIHEGLFRQVVFNLAQNAIEASSSGGVVRISAALADGRLKVTVADEGSGIAEQFQARVYEPFFTSKTAPEEAGLGLGLSVSRNIVESMGGTIGFETKPGRLTIFTITLPIRTEETTENGE